MNAPLANSQGEGKLAYISRKDCAKAVAIGNEVTGNNIEYKAITDEENYAIFDSMGVPRTTDGVFKKDSEALTHQRVWLHLLRVFVRVKWIYSLTILKS